MRIAFALCFLLAASIAAPAPAQTIGLTDAVRQAVERDPGLRASGLRVDAQEAAVTAATGAFDPTLTGRFDANTSRRTGTGFDGQPQRFDTQRITADIGVVQPLVWGTRLGVNLVTESTDTDNPFLNCIPGLDAPQCFDTQLRLSVSQPLLRGAGRMVNEAAIASATVDVERVRLDARQTAEGLVEQVVTAWVELAHADKALKIRRQALDLAKSQLDATDARIEVGTLAPADRPVVAQAVARSEGAVMAAEVALADRRAALARYLGPDDVIPGALPELEALSTSIADAKAAAEQNSAALAANEAARTQLEISRNVQRDATLPQLDLTLVAAQSGLADSLGGSLGNLPDNDTHYYGAILDFRWAPAATAADAEVARVEASLAANAADREVLIADLHQQVGVAVRQAELADRALELDVRGAALAEEALEAEQSKFDSGRSTNLDVLLVQQDLAEARLAVARAEADRLLARARLQRLTGRIIEVYGLTLDP